MKRWTGWIFVLGLLLQSEAIAQSREAPDLEIVRTQGAAAQEKQPDLVQVERRIVQLTNRFREKQGRKPVESNQELKAAAEYFAGYMAEHDRYGHNADGKRPAERAENHGYRYCIVLENIAYQYHSAGFETKELAQKFVRGWRESPEHRENMLDRDVADIGVAVAWSNKSGAYYAVQMFGRPKSMQIEFALTNESDATLSYDLGNQNFTLPPRYSRTHQICRPAKVQWQPAEGGKPQTLDPANGANYVIQRTDSGDLALQPAAEPIRR